MHYNCLIIDDEVDLAKVTCEYFEMFNVSCAYVDNSEKYMCFIQENTVDLILLDINLQKESGFELCKKIREKSDIPILFISARQSDDDVLIALNIGGDDYIRKPYTLSVLLAKVKVMMKRMVHCNLDSENHSLKEQQFGNIRIDSSTMSVFVGEKEVKLKAKEFKLFQCLFHARNTIMTKEKLFEIVWGDTYFSDGTLNVHIRKLREKIEDNPNKPKIIKTIWGTGYMMEIGET